MFMIGKGRETGTTLYSFKPYHKYKSHKKYQTVCIVQYYNHVLLGRYGSLVQKGKNFIQFIRMLP